jgi:hypothetical protein
MKMPPTVRFERERTLIEHILERLVRANPCPGAAPVAEAMEYAVMGGRTAPAALACIAGRTDDRSRREPST